MRTYTYRWLHIPSQQSGVRQIRCLSRAEFEEKIRRWNKWLPLLWTYSEE